MRKLKNWIYRRLEQWAENDAYKMVKWCDERLRYHRGEIKWLEKSRNYYMRQLREKSDG